MKNTETKHQRECKEADQVVHKMLEVGIALDEAEAGPQTIGKFQICPCRAPGHANGKGLASLGRIAGNVP